MNPHHHELYSHAIGAVRRRVVAYGHYGRPVLAFPSEGGRAYDWQDNGMIDAIGDLLEAGRVKLYCVSSFDAESWSNQSIPLEQRAREHGRYESWILDDVVPFIQHDTGGEIITTGISLGAFHAANFALEARRPVPARALHVGQLRPVDAGTAGASAASRPTSTTRSTTSASSAATTSTGCARASACCWSAARGSGRTPPARWSPPSGSRACSPRRTSATSSTCGATTSRTTGRPGAPRSPTISRGSADVHGSLDRPPARHRGGLAARVRDAAGADRAGAPTGARRTA